MIDKNINSEDLAERTPRKLDDFDPLTKLAVKYLTDKCPQIKHPFTPVYYELLKDKRESTKKVLEIGIGYREMALKWRDYMTGASLLMWREFFPNARIYGIDILPNALYKDERIDSFICDQTSKSDLSSLIQKIGADIDLIVDDGSHKTNDQIVSCQILMPLVNRDVIYIIEDVTEPEVIVKALDTYNCSVPKLRRKFRDDNLVIVTNK
jgi:hypothetical protein